MLGLGAARRGWMLECHHELGSALNYRAKWPPPRELRQPGIFQKCTTWWSGTRHRNHLPQNIFLYSDESIWATGPWGASVLDEQAGLMRRLKEVGRPHMVLVWSSPPANLVKDLLQAAARRLECARHAWPHEGVHHRLHRFRPCLFQPFSLKG
jgi:hypothetical protein